MDKSDLPVAVAEADSADGAASGSSIRSSDTDMSPGFLLIPSTIGLEVAAAAALPPPPGGLPRPRPVGVTVREEGGAGPPRLPEPRRPRLVAPAAGEHGSIGHSNKEQMENPREDISRDDKSHSLISQWGYCGSD